MNFWQIIGLYILGMSLNAKNSSSSNIVNLPEQTKTDTTLHHISSTHLPDASKFVDRN